jgi:hypothetical protein
MWLTKYTGNQGDLKDEEYIIGKGTDGSVDE